LVEIEPKIVNGTDTQIERFPFVVSLQYVVREGESWHSCGASILSSFWLLTAAHCVEHQQPERYLVEYATTEINDGFDGEKIAYIDKFIWHEMYDDDDLNDDIALVLLKTPIRSGLDFQVRLPLYMEYFATGTPAILIGWGLNESGGEIMTTLQQVDLQIFSSYDCAARHNPGWVFPTNICAGIEEGGKGQCSGDSGGPLIVNGVQVGIVSWSMKPCTIAPYPGVFTAVSNYIPWIERNTGLNFRIHNFLQASGSTSETPETTEIPETSETPETSEAF